MFWFSFYTFVYALTALFGEICIVANSAVGYYPKQFCGYLQGRITVDGFVESKARQNPKETFVINLLLS